MSERDGARTKLHRVEQGSCLLLTILLAAPFVLCGLFDLIWNQNATNTRTVDEYPAPSGGFVAVVDRYVGDLGATGSVVSLSVSLRASAGSKLLLKMGSSRSKVTVTWRDANTLVVEYRPGSRDDYDLQHVGPTEWNGVRIVYRDLRVIDPRPIDERTAALVPRPLALDRAGNVYVADPGNRRIHRLSPDLTPTASWVTRDENERGYVVDALAVGNDGALWIADGANDRVLIVSPDGLVSGEFGGSGSEGGQFNFYDGRAGIAVDASGAIYVSDSWNHRVQRLREPNRTDAPWEVFASGPGERAMTFPQSLAVGADGVVYIAETQHSRIRKLAPDGAELALWARAEKHPSQVHEPEGIALDGNGNLYVADTGNERLLKLSPEGAPLAAWASGLLSAVAVDAQGNIFTSAKGKLRVERRSPNGVVQSAWEGPTTPNAGPPGQ